MKTKTLLMKKLIFVFITLFLIGHSSTSNAITYTAGVQDNFASPTETASPSATLASAIQRDLGWGTQDFDMTAGLNYGSANKAIAHTFSNLPSGIISATLEFKIRGGDDDYVGNDDFRIGFFGDENDSFINTDPNFSVLYWVSIEYLVGTTWQHNLEATIMLDISALSYPSGSTKNLINALNTYHFIDVIVGDETAVDYMKLTVTTIPEPTTLLLLGLGLMGLAGMRRKL